MHKEARTIKVTPDSEIALLIKEAVAAGANVVVDTGEARYPLQPVAGYLTRRLKGRPLTEDDPSLRWPASPEAEFQAGSPAGRRRHWRAPTARNDTCVARRP